MTTNPDPGLRALSVRQPWAAAIALAFKPIENRTWAPSDETLPVHQVFAIHATMPGTQREQRAAWRSIEAVVQADVHRGLLREASATVGAIVAVVRYGGACTAGTPAAETLTPVERKWASGPWCWRLLDAIRLAVPVPCPGALGLWRIPGPVLDAIMRQGPETLAGGR